MKIWYPYITQLVTMQLQNVVFKPNVSQKRNRRLRFNAALYEQGWKYRLVIDNRYYILCFSAIDYHRCFAFNFFYRLMPFLCSLLTFYRLAESLNFTFWNDRRSRRLFLCFYSAIFQLTSAKFQTFAYNSRTV